jgi:hypothetical protein
MMTVATGVSEDLRGCCAVANQTRPHPELANGVAWMPVSLQPQSPPAPPAPLLPGGMVLPYLAILGAGLVLGGLLTSGANDLRARNAENRATQASQALQANQQAIDAFCKGAAK